eukprot:TRINITY_DN1952_c0_g1_i3.p2 TRINITY_DN1952_c0_g1~~TRINITY_DN1952_c0_g1_i3.p2  ORF type:complete len:105 (+),score=19.88 TRINITY_DN1952_c0_g1_i3:356-670(+)
MTSRRPYLTLSFFFKAFVGFSIPVGIGLTLLSLNTDKTQYEKELQKEYGNMRKRKEDREKVMDFIYKSSDKSRPGLFDGNKPTTTTEITTPPTNSQPPSKDITK